LTNLHNEYYEPSNCNFSVTLVASTSRISKITKMARSTSLLRSLLLLIYLVKCSLAGCPFQNPFWFYDKPVVVNKFDENGEIVANTIRLMWGRMENFKCVDYFQVEYFQRLNPEETVAMTQRVNRHRRSVEIEVVPCTIYFFKVIASEDWKGMREDFKVFSEVVRFRVDYTPKFVTQPMVKERGRTRPPPQALPTPDSTGTPVVVPQEPEEFTIKVGWRLRDIDYPICLDYFELDYYDTAFNSSKFLKPFARPFKKQKFEFEIKSTLVPCEPDMEYMLRVFGLNKKYSEASWTPPSCVVTTVPPTTTEAASVTQEAGEEVVTVVSTTESLAEAMELIQAENDRLQSKIDGLKQEYEKIGLQVFAAFKDSFFTNVEDFLLRRKMGGVEGGGMALEGNQTDPLFS
jgi:hypothetical protein